MNTQVIYDLDDSHAFRYVGTRQTRAGPITVVSEHLLDALEGAGVLTPQLLREIQDSGGKSLHLSR